MRKVKSKKRGKFRRKTVVWQGITKTDGMGSGVKKALIVRLLKFGVVKKNKFVPPIKN